MDNIGICILKKTQMVVMMIVHEMTRNPDTTDLSVTTKSNYEEKKKKKNRESLY